VMEASCRDAQRLSEYSLAGMNQVQDEEPQLAQAAATHAELDAAPLTALHMLLHVPPRFQRLLSSHKQINGAS